MIRSPTITVGAILAIFSVSAQAGANIWTNIGPEGAAIRTIAPDPKIRRRST
jgi:hypothetical protein